LPFNLLPAALSARSAGPPSVISQAQNRPLEVVDHETDQNQDQDDDEAVEK
jgi:hypothetical protein